MTVAGTRFHRADARVFVPDGTPADAALQRTTHLGVGAHSDDLEFMAYHGILACHDSADRWFCGVTCANGAGSVRSGPYAELTDAQFTEVRRREQDAAAVVGRYGAMVQLGYPSPAVRDARASGLVDDLQQLFAAARPRHVYTHNLADKHETHVAVAVAALQALRELPRELRPQTVWGCEVWRDLDWLPDEDKVRMDVSGRDNLARALTGVFDSQIVGKKYDLAVLGRRAAHATFGDPLGRDQASQLILGMDLTALVADESADIAEYVLRLVDKFRDEVRTQLVAQLRGA